MCAWVRVHGIADFGLACEKKGAYVMSRSNLAGTPRYMAPEAYRDEKCTVSQNGSLVARAVWIEFLHCPRVCKLHVKLLVKLLTVESCFMHTYEKQEKIDIYSLAMMIWEMLTSQVLGSSPPSEGGEP